MIPKRECRPLWLAIGLAAWFSTVATAAPWERLFTFNRVEADPDKDYIVTEENGPWMILACSFSGEGGREQARELVLELRSRYKLPAYIFEKTFDLSDHTVSRGVNRFGEPQRARYRRGTRFEEIAVLVGNYRSVDDPEAQETLRRLRYFDPDSLRLDEDRPTALNLAGLRLIQKYVLSPESERRRRGPMSHAFITTNPLLPEQYFSPQGLDPLVLKANEGVKHSLLDCPGKYTIQVAHFTGRVVIKQSEIAAIESGRQTMRSGLADAAEKAHKLTTALRMKGYEAYEFHDRYASIVTVGSFDSVGTPRPDGKIEINPQIRAIIDQFKARQDNLPGQPSGAMVPQTLAGIPFDVQPIPVLVPRRSISAAYARPAASGIPGAR